MNGPIWTGWHVWSAWLALLLSTGVVTGAQSGDRADGSRGQYVHVLGLYPEGVGGRKASKLTATDSQPFSLHRTCNPCHDVNTICGGWHFSATDPNASTGRLGAPVPQHRGLPPVHLEKLTCTICHSGPWPEARVGYVKTSRAHALGSTHALKAGLLGAAELRVCVVWTFLPRGLFRLSGTDRGGKG